MSLEQWKPEMAHEPIPEQGKPGVLEKLLNRLRRKEEKQPEPMSMAELEFADIANEELKEKEKAEKGSKETIGI